MMTEDYKYDVAFSFVKEDEKLASQLNDLLKPTLNTFLYAERQKEIAGKDGEEAFGNVFNKESRIVVILHRDSWGTTPWTRMEETAIKNRAFDQGYDFTIVIPVDKISTVPKWLPKNRLYLGLSRWGIEGAASVIEARVIEFGGKVKIETLAEKMARTNKEIAKERERKTKLSSEGRALSIEEFEKLVLIFKTTAEGIKDQLPDWHLRIRNNRSYGIDMISYGFSLLIQFYPENYDTYMHIKLFDGVFDDQGHPDPFHKPKLIKNIGYIFEISGSDEYGWAVKGEKNPEFATSSQLAEQWIDRLMSVVRAYRLKNGE